MCPTSYKQVDPSGLCNLLLISLALCLQVFCVSIQNVSVGWINVDVLEEVVPHVGVIALWMSTRQTWRRRGALLSKSCSAFVLS